MMAAPFRPAAGAAATFVVALALAAPGLAAQEAPTFDEGFFEVFVQRLPARVTVTTLVDERGVVLIPVRPVLDLVGIPVRTDGSLLVVEWPPDTWRTVLDLTSRTVRVGDAVETVPAEDWVVRAGDVFVAPPVLARLLAARVDVDWAGLGIVISQNLEFPATRRLELEAQRERQRLLAERMRPLAPDLPFEPRSGGLAATWGLAMNGSDGRYRGALRSAVGGSVWGGAAEAGGVANFGDGTPTTFSEGYLRYSRVFPTGTWLRQLQVGSVLSDGPVARRLDGITLTNEPYTTPRFFGEALIQPVVPAGWEYEVYQGDVLVGVASGGSPEDLRAPLNYGNTPVRIRMLGPAGQEVVEELLYVVPPTRLPLGEVRWNVGLGPCRDPSCSSYGYGEVRRGMASWLTAGVGVDRLDPTEGEPEVRPYASLGLSPWTGLNLDAQVQPGAFVSTGLDWTTASDGAYSATYAWSRPAGDAPTLDGWYAQLAATTPVNVLGGRTVSSRVQFRGTERTSVDSWLATLSSTVRRAYVSATWEHGLQERSVLTGRMFLPLLSRPDARIRDLALSAGVGASRRGGELLELGASLRPTSSTTLSLDLHARRGSSPVLSIGFTTRRTEGYAQGRASTGRGAGMFVSADGGLAYDPATGIVPLPFQSLGRAGVRGRVFHDLDGDGAYTAADVPAPGVDVLVQGERATTDSLGTYQVWEVRPYDVVQVAADSLSVDPVWVPAPRSVLLRPSPNLYNRVDLPLRPTREVFGEVVLIDADGTRPMGGVEVRVVADDGTVLSTQRTFSDGVYYFQRIPPGRFVVEIAPASREAVGAPAGPARQEIDTRGAGGEALEVPALRLEVEGR